MTKKKGIVSKLFIALVALTLISCCFLGSTFARYTSGTSGTASTNVAKWKVGFGEDEPITVNFGNLSPNQNGWTEKQNVSNSSGKKLIATITYDLGVEATLTTMPNANLKVEYITGDNFEAQTTAALAGITTETQITDLFEVKLYKGENGEDTVTTTPWENSQTLSGNGTLYLFAEIIWTTPYSEYENAEAAVKADKIDTWVGGNVSSIQYGFTLSAVQNTQQPQA